jgi:hypothetical protein
MLEKIEAFFTKEMKEKAGRLAILSLFLLVPFYPFRMFFLFLLCTYMLPWDIQHKRITSLTALPFMPVQLYWFSWLFLVTITTVTQLIGSALGAGIFAQSWQLFGIHLAGSLLFVTAYFGITMLSVIAGLDHFGIPLLVFIADLIIGGIGSPSQNPYFYISPVHQGSILLALIPAIGFVFVGAYVFSKKGASK